jgi:Cu+-exporting ATPase
MQEPFGLEDHSDESSVYSVDPVCGARVEESKAAGKTGYAGQLYYFCSVDCQEKFEGAPGRYIGQTR